MFFVFTTKIINTKNFKIIKWFKETYLEIKQNATQTK
jgi:hypothetical protein